MNGGTAISLRLSTQERGHQQKPEEEQDGGEQTGKSNNRTLPETEAPATRKLRCAAPESPLPWAGGLLRWAGG